jgi:hypothetical protein
MSELSYYNNTAVSLLTPHFTDNSNTESKREECKETDTRVHYEDSSNKSKYILSRFEEELRQLSTGMTDPADRAV